MRDCEARLGGNQVRDFGCTLDLESVNCILQHAVSIGDTFVLAQMFEPGFHEKRLDHPAFLGGILKDAPGVGMYSMVTSTGPRSGSTP